MFLAKIYNRAKVQVLQLLTLHFSGLPGVHIHSTNRYLGTKYGTHNILCFAYGQGSFPLK